MRTYSVVMEGIAALLLLALTIWLLGTARRSRHGAFRAVTLGGAGVCLLLGARSVQRLLLIVAEDREVFSSWRDMLVGPVETVLATVTVLVAAWAGYLALRNWTILGRAQRMVDVLTDRVPSEAQTRQARLSRREQEVVELIRQGILSDGDLARTLHISQATAATHVQNILKKTGLHNRRDVMLLPGMLTPEIRSRGASSA